MDILFEFLGELIFEGIIEIIKNRNISLWLRIPIYIIYSILILGLAFALTYIAFKNMANIMSLILIFVAILIFSFYALFTYKIFRKDR